MVSYKAHFLAIASRSFQDKKKEISMRVYTSNMLLNRSSIPNPIRQHFPVRTVPVQFLTFIAPEERQSGLIFRGIVSAVDLFGTCSPEHCVAE